MPPDFSLENGGMAKTRVGVTRVHTMFKTTKALVLRETKYKETDKILTLLTPDEGKLTVSARGVMGGKSKLAAACQLLAFSEMTMFERQGRFYVRETQTIEQFLGLREDICSLALGVYFAEILEAVSDEDSPSPAILNLGLNSLFALSEGLYQPGHIKAVFELRVMCLSGFEPQLDFCPACGEEPMQPVFSAIGGSVLCRKCRGPGYGETFPVSRSVIDAMVHIVNADPKRIFSFSLEDEDNKKLFGLCEAYVIAQLERGFSTLDYWKKLK